MATSTDFLELDALPKRIALVGGGYIAAEFSHIAARAGAKVTVLQSADRTLTPFDPDLVGLLIAKSREISIDIQTGARVEAIEKNTSGFTVRVISHDKHQSYEVTWSFMPPAACRISIRWMLRPPAWSATSAGSRSTNSSRAPPTRPSMPPATLPKADRR